jgi:hydroxysqualene dehydroxylase
LAAWSETHAMKVAIVGAGWAGCAAAIQATRLGHQVTLFEATRLTGGRARRVDITHNDRNWVLDNGQHILIGAYSETLKLMADVGVDEKAALLRTPLTMQFPDRSGLQLKNVPAPFDAALGILMARGWSWRDRTSLLAAAARWQLGKFACHPQTSVASLCATLTPRVMAMLIEPLCVSALNTPASRASGQVFLRVMRDALFSASGGSNLLLPRVDLSALLPDAALAWVRRHGGEVRLGCRVQTLEKTGRQWRLTSAAQTTEPAVDEFDAVVLACPAHTAAKLVAGAALPDLVLIPAWINAANDLTYEAITTVYAISDGRPLALPMMALASSSTCPAQFVFDRGQLGGPAGLLAFVVSASTGDAALLASQVLAQAQMQLGLQGLELVQTIVEKRATFACTPGLVRPGATIAPGLLAAGDYVEGPYPATLEGAVRSGLHAASLLKS